MGGRGRPRALGDAQMLAAYVLAAIGKARDVAGCENARRARLEPGIHDDAAVERKPRRFGESRARTHTYAHDHQFGIEHGSRFQPKARASHTSDGLAEGKDHS